jgi:hypothetical protein
VSLSQCTYSLVLDVAVKKCELKASTSRFLEFLPSIQKTPEYLQVTGYRNPDDPTFAPLQYTHDLKTDGFTWLCQNPDALGRFNSFMEGQRANRPYWGDWFPVRERILDHPGMRADRPLLVDIGGGRGHELIAFRERFPDAQGTLILEDLPGVIDEVQGERDLGAAGVEMVKYDFFSEVQPIHGKSQSPLATVPVCQRD